VLRIIAGQWRGRKFRFPALDIRPTPDRVRETLFNWLQPRIEGARCLDLFAGSGALGLEALSRGAASVVFVEQQRAAADAHYPVAAARLAGRGAVAPASCAMRHSAYLSAPAPRLSISCSWIRPTTRGMWRWRPRRWSAAGWRAMRGSMSSTRGAIRRPRCPRVGMSCAPARPARSGIICARRHRGSLLTNEIQRAVSRDFDPFTRGHEDIVRRAASIFARVVIAVAANPNKTPTFDVRAARGTRAQRAGDLSNVEVVSYRGLTVEFARARNLGDRARLRAVSDFEFEFQLANMGRHLEPDIETVFMVPKEQFTFISSTLVREIAFLGGDVGHFVHPAGRSGVQERHRSSPTGSTPDAQ
jgi:pantetheine-phosphate adenylyltransferase